MPIRAPDMSHPAQPLLRPHAVIPALAVRRAGIQRRRKCCPRPAIRHSRASGNLKASQPPRPSFKPPWFPLFKGGIGRRAADLLP